MDFSQLVWICPDCQKEMKDKKYLIGIFYQWWPISCIA